MSTRYLLIVVPIVLIILLGMYAADNHQATSEEAGHSYDGNISLERIYELNPEIRNHYGSDYYYPGCKAGYGYSVKQPPIGLGLVVFDGVLVGIQSHYGTERGHYPWTDQEEGEPWTRPPDADPESGWSFYTHTLFLTEPPTEEECRRGEWDDPANKSITNLSYRHILNVNPGYRATDLECNDCPDTGGYGIPERCVAGKGHYIRPDPLPGHALYVLDGKLLAVEETWDKNTGWYPWADGGPENYLVKKYGHQYFYKQTLWLADDVPGQTSCDAETYNYSKLNVSYGPQYNDPLLARAGESYNISEDAD